MKLYQSEQQKLKTNIKKKMKRQIQLVNHEVTDDQVEDMMKSGGQAGEYLKTTILQGSAPSSVVQNSVKNVSDKYREVMALESSVSQLHDMFVDFAQLVEQQGELLDQIDYQVKQAGDFLDEANVDMQQAVNYAIELRKRQCCLAVILLVVIGVIIGIVFAFKEQSS
jgi:t-SNARE complex subunit (syntaxin)